MSEDPEAPKRTVIIRRDDIPGQPANPFAVPPSSETPPPPGGMAPPPAAETPPPQPEFTPAPLPPQAAPPPAAGRFGEAGSLVGATLNDNYEVTRYITQGGMGEIYEGRQMRGNAKVAIKVILPQFAADPVFYNMLEREADLLAQLGHDAIVKFRGLSHDPRSGVDYLTLEYVPGPSLEDRMDEGPVPADQARALLRRLAAGLDTAHQRGVYHRDLSPDNILLRDGHIERATIIDFGIAKDADASKKTVIGAGFGGKLGFAAPEAFGLFGREIGAWTDIYSLALVVAAAARGRFIDMGTATPIDAINARQSVPPLDGIEPWLAGVLARMLEPDPVNRLRSMTDVIAAVDALPPVGTPHDAGAAAAATSPATAPPAAPTFARVERDDDDIPAPTTFVRADTGDAAPDTAKPKSKMPLFIGGGVVLAAIVGGVIAFSGGDTPPAPVAESTTLAETRAAAPVAAAPAAAPVLTAEQAAAKWAQVREQLGSLACSDVRAVQPADPGAASVAVSGWVSAATTVPATIAGYRLDTSGLKRISPAPDGPTCEIIGRLKAAAADAGVRGDLQMPGETVWNFGDLKTNGDIYEIPNAVRGAGRPLFLTNIEEGASPSERVASGLLPAGTAYVPSNSKRPVRYLQMFVASDTLPANGAETGDGSGIAKACASGCTTTSGWVELRGR